MRSIKFFGMLIFFSMCFLVGQSQLDEKQDTKKVNLEKIIFHSSGSTTYCPKIDLMIDSDRNIKVTREFYLKRAQTEKHYSGYFKGHMEKKEYARLIELLETCGLDSLKFPVKDCCGGVVSTLIIYYNGQRRYFRSMAPPSEMEKLIMFLNNVGVNTKLKKAKDINNFEE